MDGMIPMRVITKFEAGPQLQRAALGDIRNKRTLNHLNQGPQKENVFPTKLKKHMGTSQLRNIKENISIIQDKENVPKKQLCPNETKKNDVVPMEVDEAATMHATQIEDLAMAFSSQNIHAEDVDSEDKDNPLLVSAYVKDIYKYMWQLECLHEVERNFLDGQKITYKMRSILIDWLVQVHTKFSLLQETLYLTVAILDRYLMTNRTTVKDHLQLVGVTAMFIASKYEEMYIPEIGDFVYITDKTFSKRDIIRMEVKMLQTLKFYISFPLPLHFLRRNSKVGIVDSAHHTLAKYLMELTLPEYTFCHVKPSLLAAAALFLAINLINNGTKWTDTMSVYSNHSEREILPVVCKLSSLVIKPNKLKTIKNKYSSSKYMKISIIKELDASSRTLKKYASPV